MGLISRLAREARRTLGHLGDATRLDRVERRTELDGHPRPVLLLHGFFSTRRTLDVLEARLRRDGYDRETERAGYLAEAGRIADALERRWRSEPPAWNRPTGREDVDALVWFRYVETEGL